MAFDALCLISELEYIGVAGSGDRTLDCADHQPIQKIVRPIRQGGQLIVSVPFGKRGETSLHRVYEMAQLQTLFSVFTWRRSADYQRVGSDWMPVNPEELSEVVSPLGMVNCVAVLDLVCPA